MLDIKFVRENPDIIKSVIEQKRVNLDLDKLLALDSEVAEIKKNLQALQEQRNSHSKKIPKATNEERPALIEQGREIGKKIDEIKPSLHEKEEELKDYLYRVPNIPSPDAPIGKDENDNIEIKRVGSMPDFEFTAKDHVELLEMNGWAEFEKVAQVCGSRSYSLRDEMVLLENAMHRVALDMLREKGFNLVSMPALVREGALFGTGHFPEGRDQVYHLQEDDLYLSGTAEVQLNYLHAGEILKEDDLPILYAGIGPCFRREAGSYGRDVRGLMRVHQFMKVEQYIICKNDSEESEKWHKALLETAEELVVKLGLPYRVIECCTGDMGAGKVRMYDVECWVPSEQKFRETHSCSALYSWQARRTNTRYRDREGNVRFCHTLNNTAIATPRIMVSFLEVHQQADGSIKVPEILRPYLMGQKVLKGKKNLGETNA